MSKETTVSESVAAIQAETGLDERFIPGVRAAVSAAYDAGAKCATTIVQTAPLSGEEISVIRDTLRARVATPARTAKARR